MKQSRTMSLVEAITNVIVGYGIAVVTQILIFPIFGLHTTLTQNLKDGRCLHRGEYRAIIRSTAIVRDLPNTLVGHSLTPVLELPIMTVAKAHD